MTVDVFPRIWAKYDRTVLVVENFDGTHILLAKSATQLRFSDRESLKVDRTKYNIRSKLGLIKEFEKTELSTRTLMQASFNHLLT
jgi:hypothetical protein